jgi:hypothetical protein
MAHPDSGDGFANTKTAYAFTSREDRDAFVAHRQWDSSCKAITEKEAERFKRRTYDGDYEVPPYQADGPHKSYTGVVGRWLTPKELDDGVKNKKAYA